MGLVEQKDQRGWSGEIDQFNEFDRGPIAFYVVESDFGAYNRRDGAFFRNFVHLLIGPLWILNDVVHLVPQGEKRPTA